MRYSIICKLILTLEGIGCIISDGKILINRWGEGLTNKEMCGIMVSQIEISKEMCI